jgi:two-component system, NtrC family, sensor kinase
VTPPAASIPPLRVISIADDDLTAALIEEFGTRPDGPTRQVPHLTDIVEVAPVRGPDEAAELATAEPGVVVPLVVLSGRTGEVDHTIDILDGVPALRQASTLLLTDRLVHADAARAIDADRLDAVIAIPWTAGALQVHARSQVARWLREHLPDDQRTGSLINQTGRPLELPDGELLRDLELEPAAVTERLLAAIERVLGPRPRLHLPPGIRLTHQDEGVNAVLVVLRGSVALDRSTRVGDLRLHHGSTGPVVGLLSLAQQRRAFFTARTTTDVEVVHLSLEQLDRALRSEPEVGAAMAAVSIRALAQRLRRSEQLQVEKVELNRELDAERERLGDALHQLEQARLELVEQARFATLGELAAGIAHELNNPVAALDRAASYVAEDLERLVASHPQGAALTRALTTSRDRPPLSTAEEREQRRTLEAAVGDRELARRLLATGITDPDDARRLATSPRETIDLMEAAAGIGTAIRNLQVGADRISGLVASLRSYARPDSHPVDGVDIHEGLEDTLRLTAHRLRSAQITREYGELPPIRCHPGQLDQVWTNLLVNAAEALEGEGHIRVRTDAPDPDHVRVRISDDGPGMPPDVLERVFEPRFTTKQGTVRYGLGLGLAIARRVVEQHDGRLSLSVDPSGTTATAILPVAGPNDDTT